LGAPHTPKYNRKHIALYNNIIKPQNDIYGDNVQHYYNRYRTTTTRQIFDVLAEFKLAKRCTN
jgi:hypothetical protein